MQPFVHVLLLTAFPGLSGNRLRTDCEQFWGCTSSRVHPAQKGFPGDCAKRAPGFALGRANRWPRRCMAEFLEMITDCIDDIDPPQKQCINLAVAGAGSGSILDHLRDFHVLPNCQKQTTNNGCVHHKHSGFGALEALANAPCVIMSIREPAARLESGFRYIYGKQRFIRKIGNISNHTINDHIAKTASRYSVDSMIHPLYGFFGVPQASYFAGLTGGICRNRSVQLHVLCTEGLTMELGELTTALKLPQATVRDSNQNLRSQTRHPIVRARSRLEPKWRDWVNNELYPLDSILHGMICGGRGIWPPPISPQ